MKKDKNNKNNLIGLVIVLVLMGLLVGWQTKVKISYGVSICVGSMVFDYKNITASEMAGTILERINKKLNLSSIFKNKKKLIYHNNTPKRWWDKCRYWIRMQVLLWRQKCRWSRKLKILIFTQTWGVAI